ncbi:MAG: hypothetical protein IT331_10980 [Anaerolineae bacterium]|nr:hypothetical protein [Anaerolineae bacterium]
MRIRANVLRWVLPNGELRASFISAIFSSP